MNLDVPSLKLMLTRVVHDERDLDPIGIVLPWLASIRHVDLVLEGSRAVHGRQSADGRRSAIAAFFIGRVAPNGDANLGHFVNN
jgi:hypothetical protein